MFRLIAGFLLCCFLSFSPPNVFAKDFIKLRSSDSREVLFPSYIKKLSSKIRKQYNLYNRNSLKLNVDGDTLTLFSSLVKQMHLAARNNLGEEVLEEKINSKTIFVNSLLISALLPYVEGQDDDQLFKLFKLADYLNIEPLKNNLAYFLAKRIKEKQDLNKKLQGNDLKVLRFKSSSKGKKTNLLSPLKSQKESKDTEDNAKKQTDGDKTLSEFNSGYINKHLYFLNKNLQEFTIADYIGLNGQPSLSHGFLDLSKKKLTNLKGIDLIKNPQKLYKLDLSENELVGRDINVDFPLKPFFKFKNLYVLELSKNNFDVLPNDLLLGLHNLQFLYFNNNKIVTLPQDFLKSCKKLEEIHFYNNTITSLPKKLLYGLTKLEYIFLDHNRITEVPYDFLFNLKNLIYLDLSNNEIVTLPLGLFRDTKNIRSIFLNNNNISNLPDYFFSHLPRLEEVHLTGNNLSSLKHHFFFAPKLRSLYLDKNALKDLNRDVFSYNTNLKYLYLDYNKLDTLPEGIFNNLLKLQVLYLSHNNLAIIREKDFSSLQHLKFLMLGHNKIKEIENGAFSNLSLSMLELEYNNLPQNYLEQLKKEFSKINPKYLLFEPQSNLAS